MNVKIIGKKMFESKKFEVIKACYTFNITYEDKTTDGLACATVFVPESSYNKYKVGDMINDVYINYANHSLGKNI